MADKFYTALVIVFVTLAIFLLCRAGRSPTSGFWIFSLLAVGSTFLLLRHGRPLLEDVNTGVILGVFLSLLVLSVLGRFPESVKSTLLPADVLPAVLPESAVAADPTSKKTLFVLIHGFSGGADTWDDVTPELRKLGDVLPLEYPAYVLTNADPELLAVQMAARIEEVQRSYGNIVMVGHSMGALLLRKTFLVGQKTDSQTWAHKVGRLVLMAGMNRGWDVTGKRPMDMSVERRVMFWAGSWFGRLTHTGGFILGGELGAPFVANLRLEWMRWFRKHPDHQPEIVQLLGDIDDLVSDEDNKDIAAAGTSRFYWLRVRGTGHRDIVKFSDTSGAMGGYEGIGPYRRDKFRLAITGTGNQLAANSEELQMGKDPNVKRVVFVLHGIRDLGEWSANFEEELQKQYPASASNKLQIVSLRYGYFGMGSFLFQPDRQKYVRWLMDQITESLAKYENVEVVDFFAHSNGTYLLASALDQYKELQLNRIAFAGSVVRKDYVWSKVLGDQVKYVRNYYARDDLVVGLFPRFFELPGVTVLHNKIGSAGFNGFQVSAGARDQVENVRVDGGHGAFQKYVPEISGYLLAPQVASVPLAAQSSKGSTAGTFIRFGILAVWAILLLIVAFPGVRVAIAAGEYAWIPVALYLTLLFLLLKRL